MRVETVRSPDAFDRLRGEWQEFVSQRGCGTPCLSGPWVSSWWHAFGDPTTTLLLARDDAGRLAGAMLARSSRAILTGVAVAQLDFAANPHSFRMDIAAGGDGVRDEALLCLVRHALSGPNAPDTLSFRDIPACSPTLPALARVADRCGLTAVPEWSRRSPIIPLEGTWESYLRGRSKSFRSFLRRACRRAAEAGILFEDVVEGSRQAAVLEEGLRLEASGWKGEGSHAILNRSAVAEFYRRLVSHPDGANGVRQYLLRMDGRLIAWDLCVVHERVCHALKTAYDESEAALSPGFVLQALELETLFRQRKLRAYDLLPPESAFKARWTDESLEQIHVRLYTRTPRARLARLVHAGLRPGLRRIRSLQVLKRLISSE